MKKIIQILGMMVALAFMTGCGERVTVTANEVAVVMDNKMSKPFTKTTARLEMCMVWDTSCQKLIIAKVDDISDSFEMTNRYFSKDNEVGSYVVNVVYRINPNRYNDLFNAAVPLTKVSDTRYELPVSYLYSRYAEKQTLSAIDYIHNSHSITELLNDSDNVTELFMAELYKSLKMGDEEPLFIPYFVGVENVKPSEDILKSLTREKKREIQEANDQAEHKRKMAYLELQRKSMEKEISNRKFYMKEMQSLGYTMDHMVQENMMDMILNPDEVNDDQNINLTIGVPHLITPTTK